MRGAATARLPLIIGISGHRDLDAPGSARYRRHIAGLLKYLRSHYPCTPLRVISGLAAGADRLAAEVALDAGCELLVPLPLDRRDYERDFPDSVAEFRAILRRVARKNVFAAPNHGSARLRPASPAAYRESRYRDVGVYVATQSHILLALWDGLPGRSRVGTAAVVRFKLADRSGPVFHIPTRRTNGDSNGRRRAQWIFPRGTGLRLFKSEWLRIEKLNRCHSTLTAQPRRKLTRARLPA